MRDLEDAGVDAPIHGTKYHILLLQGLQRIHIIIKGLLLFVKGHSTLRTCLGLSLNPNHRKKEREWRLFPFEFTPELKHLHKCPGQRIKLRSHYLQGTLRLSSRTKMSYIAKQHPLNSLLNFFRLVGFLDVTLTGQSADLCNLITTTFWLYHNP